MNEVLYIFEKIVTSGYDTGMTQLLEKAIEWVRVLPPVEQDAIAQMMLDELESERLWDARFATSSDALMQRADNAWSEHEAGKGQPLDPDTL